MSNQTCRFICLITAIAMQIACSFARAQEQPYPDVSAKQLDAIREALQCPSATNEVGKTGCEILAEFTTAGAPQPQLLKESNGLNGRRWLGVTVVIGGPNTAGKEVRRPWPYFNLIALGARYSDNFHQKLWYENGYAPIYIWPTRDQEIALIEQAALALLDDRVDKTNPAVRFASRTDLEFGPVRASTDKSLLLGDETTYLRQRDATLYLIEIGSQSGVEPNYWLSRVAIGHLLER